MKNDQAFRNIYKIILLERCRSAEEKRGRIMVKNPRPGKPAVKNGKIPAFWDWVTNYVIEANGNFLCDLMFRSMVHYVKYLLPRNPQSKAALIVDGEGVGFLHIFCWDQKRDDEYRTSYEGQQVEWRDTMPRNGKFIGIDGMGHTVHNKWESKIILDDPFSFLDMIQLYTQYKPDCGQFAIHDNKLILEVFPGADYEKYKEAMSKQTFALTKSQLEAQQNARARVQQKLWDRKAQEEKDKQKRVAAQKGLMLSSEVSFEELRRADIDEYV